MWFMVSVAFHRLVLKYSFMLERRASSYKRCAAVVNTYHILHHLFFSVSPVLLPFLWLFSEPSSISVSLGNYGCQNWIRFSKRDYICFRYRVNDVLEGAEKGCFSAAPPRATLCCWRKQSNLSTTFPALSSGDSSPPFSLHSVFSSVHPALP